MKVYVHSLNRTKKKIGGKEFFAKRLSKGLQNVNVEITKDINEKHDISLYSIFLGDEKNIKKVLRLDGVYMNVAMKYEEWNKKIKKSFDIADGIVYQSLFSKRICDRYLGKFKGPTTIIGNGLDCDFYSSVKCAERKYDHIFLTTSRWRPHKRLRDIIKCFEIADIKNSCLYVAGDISVLRLSDKKKKKYFDKKKNVFYLGKLSQKELSPYIKVCDAFIHLCWIDNCPNGVVEAIAAGKTVITNNTSGTMEIVRPSNGIICDIDKPYDLEPCRLYHPPKFDYNIVAKAMHSAINNKREIYKEHIEIRNIAYKYKQFFKDVLDKG